MPDQITPIITVDTREPADGGWEPYFTVPVMRAKLDTGDYSIVGCEEWIAVERKSLDDLISCLTTSRERFTEELRRAQRIRDFYVIIEGLYADLLRGNYHSRMNPRSAWASVIAMQQRFGIPFLFAGTTRIGAQLCESILTRWYREHVKVLDEARKAGKRLRRQAVTGATPAHAASGEIPF